MSGFDRLARPYRWMEYVSFGHALERCRFHFLPQLSDTCSALLLGDGDGRFAERLLRAMTNSQTRKSDLGSQTLAAADVVVIDGSKAMLDLLRERCTFAGDRLVTCVADLSRGLPKTLHSRCFDLVTTHFFLDCLSTAEVEQLVIDVRPRLAAHARWVVSEFAVPARGAMRLPAWLVVRGLYLSFRLLTGLQAQRLPEYRRVLQAHGFKLDEQSRKLGGLLVAELWHCRTESDVEALP